MTSTAIGHVETIAARAAGALPGARVHDLLVAGGYAGKRHDGKQIPGPDITNASTGEG